MSLQLTPSTENNDNDYIVPQNIFIKIYQVHNCKPEEWSYIRLTSQKHETDWTVNQTYESTEPESVNKTAGFHTTIKSKGMNLRAYLALT